MLSFDERRARILYATSSSATMGLLLIVVGKPVELWVMALLIVATFLVAYALYGKLD